MASPLLLPGMAFPIAPQGAGQPAPGFTMFYFCPHDFTVSHISHPVQHSVPWFNGRLSWVCKGPSHVGSQALSLVTFRARPKAQGWDLAATGRFQVGAAGGKPQGGDAGQMKLWIQKVVSALSTEGCAVGFLITAALLLSPRLSSHCTSWPSGA